MKPAQALCAGGLVAVVMLSGCGERNVGWVRQDRGPAAGTESAGTEGASRSAPQAPGASPAGATTQPASLGVEPTSSAEPMDEDVASLAGRIAHFVGQFPVDDLIRKTGYGPPAVHAIAATSKPAEAEMRKPQAGSPAPGPTVSPAPGAVSPQGTMPPRADTGRTSEPPASAPAAPTSADRPSRAVAVPSRMEPSAAEPSVSDSPAERSAAFPAPAGPTAAPGEPAEPHVELIDVRPAVGPIDKPEPSEAPASANRPVGFLAGAAGPAPGAVPGAAAPGAAAPEGAGTAVVGERRSPGEITIAPGPSEMTTLIERLEQAVSKDPKQLDEQFRLRLLYLAADQDDKASEAIDVGDPMQAVLLKTVFRMVAAARRAMRQPAAPASEALTTAAELHRLLSQQAPVVIPKIALVTRVTSFGDYEVVDPPRFAAGRPVHVFLYTEVANFRSEPTADGRLRTVVSQKVEVFDAAGKVIWQRTEPQIEDRVLSPRRDFFIPMEIRLPADTPPGEYVLKATIEDKISATTDQQRMTFSIVK